MDPRPAATVIVARSFDDGIEVLALTRAAASRFAPGFTVFPGGAIEPGDEGLAARLFGAPDEAARACALRELYEEAGVLLTAEGPQIREPGEPIDTIRFDPPAPDMLVEVSRWIAPEQLEKRFDARFFATGAPAGLRPHPDGTEIEDARWARPEDLLAAAERGDATLMWPTYVTLRELQGCRSVADVLALRVDQVDRIR
ncbi:MAG TPA: NUDIX hydrolase [Actinomycetota bacterium]|nr:NUDIX hydrolase [Actinomycetota bacterium]